jgi:hypothetical protein
MAAICWLRASIAAGSGGTVWQAVHSEAAALKVGLLGRTAKRAAPEYAGAV